MMFCFVDVYKGEEEIWGRQFCQRDTYGLIESKRVGRGSNGKGSNFLAVTKTSGRRAHAF